MANTNPFDGGASHGIGQRIERVADQGKNLLDTDALKHTDQRLRDCLGHSSDILAAIALIHGIAAAAGLTASACVELQCASHRRSRFIASDRRQESFRRSE
jgi:hypothetical protein